MIRVIILAFAAILIPTIQHFVVVDDQLDNCLLADICNHTWIPECGELNRSEQHLEPDFRVFIDECDMFEYNCDYDKRYELTNFSECFPPICLHVPQQRNRRADSHSEQRFRRAGDYKVMENRRLIYAPVKPTYPMHMLHGKRRYTPQPGRKLRKTTLTKPPKSKKIQKKIPPKKVPKQTQINRLRTSKPAQNNIVLQRVTVRKNGRVFIKVVKGVMSTQTTRSFATEKHDSEFLE